MALNTYLRFMTKHRMKKILIIDDKPLEGEDREVIGFMIDRWLSDRVGEFSDLVDVSKKASDYFDWDKAGEYCKPLFETEEYDFIFIHHSQNGDGIFPSNIIDLIKEFLGERLVLFSGAITECFLNKENDGFVFRSIQRHKLWDKIREFVKKSSILQEWNIEILFYDYERFLIGKLMEIIDNDSSRVSINSSKELRHFLKLKYIEPGMDSYDRIMNCPIYNLIDELRNL